jgi:hypothetical protein
MTPRARLDHARCAAIANAVDRIFAALEHEPPERWLSSLGTTVSYVIRCADPEDRMLLAERWCELLRHQVSLGIREDAN